MKRTTQYVFAVTLVSAFIFATNVQASGDHDGGHGDDHHDSGSGHSDHHDSGSGHGDHHDGDGHGA